MYAQRQREEITIDQDDDDDVHVVDAADDDGEDEGETIVLKSDGSEDDDREPALKDDDDPFSDLEKQLATLKKRAENVEAENVQLRQHAEASEADVVLSQQAVIGHAIANSNNVLRQATAELDAALKGQDGARAAKAQRAIIRAEMDLADYERAADELKTEIEQAKRKPKEQPKPKGSGDAYLDSIAHMDKQAQDWLVKNRGDIEGNPKRATRAVAAHNLALTEDIAPNTPEYFAFLDKQMGYPNGKASDVTTKKRERTTAKRQVSAPGGGRASSNNGRREVHLTAAERQTATAMGMTAAKYAANKLQIEENGRNNADGLRFYRDSNQGRAQSGR